MTTPGRRRLYWLSCGFAAWLFATSCSEVDRNSWLEPPKMAPAFVLESLSGDPVASDSLRGSTLVIDFWATWCPPCIDQIPVLNRFAADRAHQDVRVLGIAVDVDGREIVAPFAAEHGIEYSVLLGDESLAQRFGALGFPALFVVSASGEIESVHFGLISLEELHEAVDDAM